MVDNPDNVITKVKLDKYFSVTVEALGIAEKSVNPVSNDDALIILDMVKRYVSDAKFFRDDKSDWVNAFAALNYAHGWLDTGSKLGIFLVDDDRLFVVK